MAVYVKWNCREIGSGADELREALSRLSTLVEELRGIGRKLDPQLAEYEGIERSLRALLEGAEEDARRVKNQCNALDGVQEVYTRAEHTVMRASESLPTSITERNLVFAQWFTDLLG